MARILQVIHSLSPSAGGPPQNLKDTTRLLVARGNTVDVASLDAPSSGWTVEGAGHVALTGPGKGFFGYTKRLPEWLDANIGNYDHVLIRGLWQYHAYATGAAARRAGVPYSVFPHGMLDPWFNSAFRLKHLKKILYWRAFESRTIAHAKNVLFTTELECELAKTSFKPYRANSVVLGYGCIAPPWTPGGDSRDGAAQPYILFLGRLHPKKRLELLIDAFAAAHRQGFPARLMIAGDGDAQYVAALRKRIDDLGIGALVTWAGFLKGDAKWQALRQAELFMLPSFQENFGIAVAEALSQGVPAIVSSGVNISADIERANAGFVTTGDVDELSERLLTWSRSGSEYRTGIKENAWRLYSRQFNLETIADRLNSIVNA